MILKVYAQLVPITSWLKVTVAGVLTKSDTVRPGEYSKWLKILRNKAYPLLHGYYITRHLTTEERVTDMLSWQKGREIEDEFFRDHDIWSREDPARLGTARLSKALSELLAELIRKRSIP